MKQTCQTIPDPEVIFCLLCTKPKCVTATKLKFGNLALYSNKAIIFPLWAFLSMLQGISEQKFWSK